MIWYCKDKVKVPANRIMILTPHCIQLDTCVHKITRNVENCHQCGGCSVGAMLALAHKYGPPFCRGYRWYIGVRW